MGKLICVCDKADTDCEKTCPKGKFIKPDHVMHYPGWPRKIINDYFSYESYRPKNTKNGE